LVDIHSKKANTTTELRTKDPCISYILFTGSKFEHVTHPVRLTQEPRNIAVCCIATQYIICGLHNKARDHVIDPVDMK